jgi:hypothetical protein
MPRVWVSDSCDHLPDRFDHQFRLILVDVVATVFGDEEARVRNERRKVLVGRTCPTACPRNGRLRCGAPARLGRLGCAGETANRLSLLVRAREASPLVRPVYA